MSTFPARVSFSDVQGFAVEAIVEVSDGHLAISADGRTVGRWAVGGLRPRQSGDSLVVFAEGEHLVIDVSDPESLRLSLGLREALSETEIADEAGGEGSRVTRGTRTGSLQDLQTSLASAQEQLRWVQDLVPRRLPILTRADEAGLGVVQGVSLKERRPLPGSEGLQPWVVVDAGNVYVTDRRLVFSGAQELEFEFDEIVKKGASRTGLLLGVSSRSQTHILAGPGERLAIVLTAAEKIARGMDPTVPFREAVARLTGEIDRLEHHATQVFEYDRSAPDQPADIG